MFSGVSVELKTCNAALLEAAGKSWEDVRYFCTISTFLVSIFCIFEDRLFLQSCWSISVLYSIPLLDLVLGNPTFYGDIIYMFQ